MIFDKTESSRTITNDISLFGNKLIEKFLTDLIILEEDKEKYKQALDLFFDWVNSLEEKLLQDASSGYYETILPYHIRKYFYFERDIDYSQIEIYNKLYFLDKIKQDYFSGNLKMSAYLDKEEYVIRVKFYWH